LAPKEGFGSFSSTGLRERTIEIRSVMKISPPQSKHLRSAKDTKEVPVDKVFVFNERNVYKQCEHVVFISNQMMFNKHREVTDPTPWGKENWARRRHLVTIQAVIVRR
jgi:plasmid rolling circle replication initiator protein Rep